MKLKHIAIIGSLFPILFSLVLFFGVLISADSDDENSNFSSGITGMNLSAEVLKHQPMVEKYARENGISEYVNVLLAIIQVESGGTAEDVMQSSESLGLPPNSLDTESSIKQGCKYFASLAVWLWKYVLCGISQSVFNCTAGIRRTGTKGNE